jgi:hypothetical protein
VEARSRPGRVSIAAVVGRAVCEDIVESEGG